MKIIITVSACSLSVAGLLFGSSLQEQNKAIARRAFEEILSGGRFELAEQLYAKDFINHGIHRNASVPEKFIAEGDLVTIYWVATGTNTGQATDCPQRGKRRNWLG